MFDLFPDDLDYELLERMAILDSDNDEVMHPVHLKNKANKEIRERELSFNG